MEVRERQLRQARISAGIAVVGVVVTALGIWISHLDAGNESRPAAPATAVSTPAAPASSAGLPTPTSGAPATFAAPAPVEFNANVTDEGMDLGYDFRQGQDPATSTSMYYFPGDRVAVRGTAKVGIWTEASPPASSSDCSSAAVANTLGDADNLPPRAGVKLCVVPDSWINGVAEYVEILGPSGGNALRAHLKVWPKR